MCRTADEWPVTFSGDLYVTSRDHLDWPSGLTSDTTWSINIHVRAYNVVHYFACHVFPLWPDTNHCGTLKSDCTKVMNRISCMIALYRIAHRLTLKLSCPMDLTHFPMDRQECHIRIESCEWTLRHGWGIWVYVPARPTRNCTQTNFRLVRINKPLNYQKVNWHWHFRFPPQKRFTNSFSRNFVAYV